MSVTQAIKLYASNPNAKPSIAYPEDAAFDLCYNGKENISPFYNNCVYKLPTGIHVEIPSDKCGIIFERSGLGSKNGLQILGRIVDSGYRGEIIVICGIWATSIRDYSAPMTPEGVFSQNINPLNIKTGDRIAQMVIVNKYTAHQFVDSLTDLCPAERGTKGLGSSGKS